MVVFKSLLKERDILAFSCDRNNKNSFSSLIASPHPIPAPSLPPSLPSSFSDPYIVEFIVGFGYFLADLSLMMIYFAPKAYLLFSGADLNAEFEIVKKKQSKAISPLEYEPNSRRFRRKSVLSGKVYPLSRLIDDKERYSSRSIPSKLIKQYCSSMPKTIDESERIIDYYRLHIMQLTQIATDTVDDYQ